MSEKPKIIIITGPTASGKTGLSVQLALSFGAQIINADSMQVYRYMDIGTAKPSLLERRGIVHHLLDVVNPDEEFNAAIYRQLALPIAKGLSEKSIHCFVVGGTGLYIRSLLGGLVDLPPVDPLLREHLHREYDRLGPTKCHQKLAELDPQRAKSVHPNDRVRIIRSLEIIKQTSSSSSDLLSRHQFKNREFTALTLCLKTDMEKLYKRINKRTEKMISDGLIEETAHLLEKGYGPHLKSMNAIGYRHILKYLKGEWSLEMAKETLKRDTRRFAKRQMTWFRAEPNPFFVDPSNPGAVEKKIRGFLLESA